MSAGTLRVYHRCGKCGKKRDFINSGKFRVNANGNLLDVWLIFRGNIKWGSGDGIIYECDRLF